MEIIFKSSYFSYWNMLITNKHVIKHVNKHVINHVNKHINKNINLLIFILKHISCSAKIFSHVSFHLFACIQSTLFQKILLQVKIISYLFKVTECFANLIDKVIGLFNFWFISVENIFIQLNRTFIKNRICWNTWNIEFQN